MPCSAVAIVPAAEMARRAHHVPASFSLRFPRRWRPAPVKNVHAGAIERETLAWLRRHGIGGSPDEAEKLRKFDCGMYGGCSLPLAPYEPALLVTQFISLWLFWDDVQVEEDQGWDVEEVVRALTRPAEVASSSRYVAAWADIGRRLCATQSASWLANLGTTMRQWLANAKIETGMAKAYQRGAVPEFTTLFDCRTISIGMFPTFHLIEYADGIGLPEEVHAHAAIVELKRLASRLVGLGNDLGGLAKDIHHRWLNLAIVWSETADVPIEAAFQHVVDIHNRDVLEFDRLAATLPSWGAATDRTVAQWIRSVRFNVHGFTLWEATAERYQEHKALAGDTALLAPVVYRRREITRLKSASSPRAHGSARDLYGAAR